MKKYSPPYLGAAYYPEDWPETEIAYDIQKMKEAGITVYGGVYGDADDAVQDFLNGTLNYNPCVRCSHHDHDQGHTCGDHGCGSHSCH